MTDVKFDRAGQAAKRRLAMRIEKAHAAHNKAVEKAHTTHRIAIANAYSAFDAEGEKALDDLEARGGTRLAAGYRMVSPKGFFK